MIEWYKMKYTESDMKMTERIPIPFRASEYVRIYTPLPDIYNGVDTEHFRSGMRYKDWITNDFSYSNGQKRMAYSRNNSSASARIYRCF